MSSSSIDKDISHQQGTDIKPVSSPPSEGRIVKIKDADVTLRFMDENDPLVPPIEPKRERKLKRKVFFIILLYTSVVNLLLYMDKATLSYASILGFWEDTGLDQNKYNNINSIFYAGFAVGQIPGNYLLQKLSIRKFLTLSLALWTIITLLTCSAYNYAGVIVLRFFLGFTESAVIPALEMTMSMFLDSKQKISIQPIFYASCMGSPIPTGFIAYGALFANSHIHSWRILMIIIGGLTFFLTLAVFFWYPDNPTDAKFLSRDERVWVIRRVQKSTSSSIEQRVFKKHQFIEALKDPVSWLFTLFFLLQQLANNLAYQQNLLFVGIGGVSNLGSTLVSVAGGGFAIACALCATLMLHYLPGYNAWIAWFWTLPAFCGSIALVALPWDRKLSLLACLVLSSQTFGVPWIIAFGWTSTTCSGYTKRITRNALICAGYAISNIISPQLWQEKDAPRFTPAWIVQIVCSFFAAPLILIIIRYILIAKNKRRFASLENDARVGVVEKSDDESGNCRDVVDIAMLDLTDQENKTFIYPL